MQRWMQAKDQLARSHGRTVSGAGRPMGYVSEDRPVGLLKGEPKPPANPRNIECVGRKVVTVTPILRRVNGTVVVRKSIDKLPRKLRDKLLAVRTSY